MKRLLFPVIAGLIVLLVLGGMYAIRVYTDKTDRSGCIEFWSECPMWGNCKEKCPGLYRKWW
jgi:hypothetical protein